jgi:hypothetical protein
MGRNIPNGPTSTPDFQPTNLLEFFLELFTIIRRTVVIERSLSLSTIDNAIVEVVEDRLQRTLELLSPIDCTTPGSGRASSIHVIHTVSSNERIQRLSSFLNSFVEGFTWAVTTFSEHFVLSEEHTVNTAHKATTFTIEIGIDFLLKGGFVEVSTTDGNTHGNGLLESFASYILKDGYRRVDSTTFAEQTANSSAGTLWSDEDDINVSWDIDLGSVFEDWREPVREVKGLNA